MEENNEELYKKDVKVKGIDTTGNDNEPEDKKDPIEIEPEDNESVEPVEPTETTGGSSVTSYDPYKSWETPANEQEAFDKQIAVGLGTPGENYIKGDPGIYSEAYNKAIHGIHLENYIPDGAERQKFLDEHGEAVYNVEGGKYGITFENEFEDLLKFRQSQYPERMKRFLDDLDENQSFMEESAKTGIKLLGSTALAIGSVLPTAYGLVNGLVQWDSSKIFDNVAFDAWESMQKGIDDYTVVYGGSDIYNFDPETGKFKQKDFLARMWNDPIKSVNQDIVPAAAFIAGAIGTELLMGAAVAGTGGAAIGGFAANTARLGQKAKKLFSSNKVFSESMKTIRGIDNNVTQLNNLKNSAKIAGIRESFTKAGATATRGYMSASYESALIARDTQDRTLNNLLIQHREENGGQEPSQAMMKKYEQLAADAGDFAYMMNIPLVAGSNFVQFPKLMMKSYRTSAKGASLLGKRGLKGTRYDAAGKKIVANADKNKYLTALGYGTNILSKGVSEGWEEFAQGAMEEGLVDYFTHQYSKDSAFSYADMASSIAFQASKVLDTQEGRDSVTIGAMMGLLGMPMFIRTTKDGKLSLKPKWYGGAVESYIDTKRDVVEAREQAEVQTKILQKEVNDENVNPILSANFRNTLRHMGAQKNMDSAAISKDVYEFKNSEHQSYFSFVQNRVNNGIEDTIFQDLEAERNLTVAEFNKKYSPKDESQFTEESKKEAIDKAEQRARKIIKNIQTVQTLVNDSEQIDLISTAKKLRELREYGEDMPLTASEIEAAKGIQEQMAYLYSAVENAQEREGALEDIIREKTGDNFDSGLLNGIKATPKGVKLSEEGDKGGVTFSQDATEILKMVMQEWKKNDINSFNRDSESVRQELKDIIKLKIRRAKAAAMYKGMFTPKGAKFFREFAHDLISAHAEKVGEQSEKNVEKQAKRTKSASIKNVKKNEASLSPDGSTPIYNEKERNDFINFNEKYNKINKDALNAEGLYQEIKKLLHTGNYPAVFSNLLDALQKQGVNVTGIMNMEELNKLSHPNLENAVVAALSKVLKDFKIRESSPKNQPKADSAEDYNQPAKDPDFEEDTNTETATKETDSRAQQKENSLWINTDEIQLEETQNKEGKTIVVGKRDAEGNYIPNPAANNPAHKVDYKKVNSPDFLDNKTLEENNVEFEFRVAKNEWNDREETTVENLWIDVYYTDPNTGEESVVGRVPAVKDNSPQHLIDLRKEVARRNELAGKPESKSAEKNKESQIADIERKRQKELDENSYRIYTKERKYSASTEQSGKGEVVIRDSADGKKHLFDVHEKGGVTHLDSFDGRVSDKKILEAFEDLEFISETDINKSRVKDKINDKYDAELARLKDKPTSSKPLNYKTNPKQKQKEELTNDIVSYVGLKDKRKKAQVKKNLEEKYGKEEIERALAIEENFQSIVEQMGDKKINVFFSEEEQIFKKCE